MGAGAAHAEVYTCADSVGAIGGCTQSSPDEGEAQKETATRRRSGALKFGDRRVEGLVIKGALCEPLVVRTGVTASISCDLLNGSAFWSDVLNV